MEFGDITTKTDTIKFFSAASKGHSPTHTEEVFQRAFPTTEAVSRRSLATRISLEPSAFSLQAKISSIYESFRPQDYSKDELQVLKAMIENEKLDSPTKISVGKRVASLFSKAARSEVRSINAANKDVSHQLVAANWTEKKLALIDSINRQLQVFDDSEKVTALINRVHSLISSNRGHPILQSYTEAKNGELLESVRENLNRLPPPSFRELRNPMKLDNREYITQLQRLGSNFVQTQKNMTLSQKQENALVLMQDLVDLLTEPKRSRETLELVYEDFVKSNIKTPDFLFEVLTTPLSPSSEKEKHQAQNYLINSTLLSTVYR